SSRLWEARMDRVEVRPGVEATRDFAFLLRPERVLVISDLHLGFEGALAEQGVSIPRFQRRVILERLGKMLDRNKAEQVVIAGRASCREREEGSGAGGG